MTKQQISSMIDPQQGDLSASTAERLRHGILNKVKDFVKPRSYSTHVELTTIEGADFYDKEANEKLENKITELTNLATQIDKLFKEVKERFPTAIDEAMFDEGVNMARCLPTNPEISQNLELLEGMILNLLHNIVSAEKKL